MSSTASSTPLPPDPLNVPLAGDPSPSQRDGHRNTSGGTLHLVTGGPASEPSNGSRAYAIDGALRSFPLRLDHLGLRQSERWLQLSLDCFFIVLNAAAVFYVTHLSFAAGTTPVSRHVWGPLIALSAATLWCCNRYGIYDAALPPYFGRQITAVVKAGAVSALGLAAILLLCGGTVRSVAPLTALGVLNVGALAGWRVLDRKLLEHGAASNNAIRNVVIVGTGTAAVDLSRFLSSNPHLGYRIRGFISHGTPAQNSYNEKPAPVLGSIDDLERIACSEFVDEIFVTPPCSSELVENVARRAAAHHFDVRIVPELWVTGSRLTYLGDVPVIAVHREPVPAVALAIKRAIDVTGSLLSLIVSAPLLVAIAVAIKLDSAGTVFYRSTRVGKKGRKFVFYKFRTMVSGADLLKEQLRELNERKGLLFKVARDPRVTRVGRFLRRYSLDELPQLWNVLIGDMSLVGPRPPSLDEYENYGLNHLARVSVKPGITGLWQVEGREHPSFDTAVAMDLEYINTWSLRLDLKLLCRTIPAVLKGTGR